MKLDFNERADSIPAWLNDFKIDTASLWSYPDKQKLTIKIAKQFDIESNHVFISNGGDEAIELLFKNCQLNNQSVLLPLPAFSQYTQQLNVWNIDYLTLEARADYSIDVQAIKENLQPQQWLILTRPNNPTGECLDSQELVEILNQSQKVGAYVFLDEAYIEFFEGFENRLYAKEYNNVLSLRTFSKAFGLAGARVGYLLGSSNLIEQFKSIAMPFNVNRLSLQLADQALDNINEVNRYCAKIDINRSQCYRFLKQSNVEVFNGKGNFLLLRLKPQLKQLVSNYLSKQNIQIKNQMQGLDDCLRITIPEKIEKLMLALYRIFKPEILGFDMDGVLINTSESYDVCIQKTVESMTKYKPSKKEINQLRQKGGFNNDWDLAYSLINKYSKNIQFNTVKNCFQDFYLGVKGMPGLIDKEVLLLDKSVWNEWSTRKVIITGRPRTEALNGVEKLNINADKIISADDVSEQKPSPQGILKIQKNYQSTNMWYIGDTVDDMQAGNQSNCVCIGIGNTENSKNLYQAGADLVLENINQISQLNTTERETI
jgi:histidinol-phosphate aminotransferase